MKRQCQYDAICISVEYDHSSFTHTCFYTHTTLSWYNPCKSYSRYSSLVLPVKPDHCNKPYSCVLRLVSVVECPVCVYCDQQCCVCVRARCVPPSCSIVCRAAIPRTVLCVEGSDVGGLCVMCVCVCVCNLLWYHSTAIQIAIRFILPVIEISSSYTWNNSQHISQCYAKNYK